MGDYKIRMLTLSISVAATCSLFVTGYLAYYSLKELADDKKIYGYGLTAIAGLVTVITLGLLAVHLLYGLS